MIPSLTMIPVRSRREIAIIRPENGEKTPYRSVYLIVIHINIHPYKPGLFINRNMLYNAIHTYLIGGIPTPLKNMKVRLDYHPNYWGK